MNVQDIQLRRQKRFKSTLKWGYVDLQCLLGRGRLASAALSPAAMRGQLHEALPVLLNVLLTFYQASVKALHQGVSLQEQSLLLNL